MADSIEQMISIVIVHYKTPQMLMDCIKSIYDNTKEIGFEIIIVDNCSEDKSEELIKSIYHDVVWVQNKSNEGFGRANNRGIKIAKCNIVLLLNSDTIIIENAIVKLYDRFINDSENIGMATCQLLNPDLTKQKSVFNYNSSFVELMFNNILIERFLSIIKFKKQGGIRAIHGACMIFNRKRIAQIGYFDPDFFMYAEEFEWCNRVLKGGFLLSFYDDIYIFHLEGGSNAIKEWNIKQRYISGALLFRKNRGWFGYIFYLIILVFNNLTNYCLLWKMDELYREDFHNIQKIHFKLVTKYFQIIFGVYAKPLKVK